MSQTCHAKGCDSPIRGGPFCGFHWDLLPRDLQREWREKRRDQPWRPILSRMIAAVEHRQFGPRLPL